VTSEQLIKDQRFRLDFYHINHIHTDYFDWALREIFFSVKRGDIVYWLVRWVPTNDFVGEQYNHEYPLSFVKEMDLAHSMRYLERAKDNQVKNNITPANIAGQFKKYYWNWDTRRVFNLEDLKRDNSLLKYKLPFHPLGTSQRPKNTEKQAKKKKLCL